MEETMSEGFTIANFRSVAHGLQEGQFAVGERKKASGLRDLDPKYKRLLDEPVTMTLGLIGPDDRIGLTPMWFDYEGDKILVNTASHRHKCEWIRKSLRLTILLVNPNNPYHWVQIGVSPHQRDAHRGRTQAEAARPASVHARASPVEQCVPIPRRLDPRNGSCAKQPSAPIPRSAASVLLHVCCCLGFRTPA